MAEGRAAPALALVFNAFVWGLSWWPLRELQARGLHPLWASAAVFLVCLAVVLALRPGLWRGIASQPQLWWLMAATGLTNVGFNWAVTVGDVVRVVLLFYLMPAWSVLLAWLLLGERPTAASLARLVLALAGVVIILKTPETPWPVPQSLPDVLALLGGFGFALTNILLRRARGIPAITRVGAMFSGGVIAALGTGLLGAAHGSVPAPSMLPPAGVAIALALGACFLLSNSALQFGATRLPAQTTALIMLSEVLFASASSVLAGASELSARTWLGGALVVAAAAWSAASAPSAADRGRAQSPA
jgi:drug/metabolite transporter (DMT)-like permease